MSLFDIPVRKPDSSETTLGDLRGQVLLIVNVASKCAFSGQYAGLEALHQKYKDRGFAVLGFPCNQFAHQEPGDDAAIQQTCQVKFGATFPVFAKIDVNGASTHPLYALLKHEQRGTLWTTAIKWNFTKFLVDRKGNVAARIGTATSPGSLEARIEKLLNQTV